ncbi:uncharacterized protein LOC131625348 [Vicia villosa]|uniref:uncharacterized protein LOC131625348 n=1 Tax=Vicia villosa TaxID=3911 RepID=UPI00273B1B91|nr:uncharacterized protein LOC131625348 [Vicia villosa]XP_058752196.1 uncharacterized protein LOC131625348 [Vicia villosa]XP_058752197.1 uncharacterized protein LOC131625348 [Vicia villosa]
MENYKFYRSWMYDRMYAGRRGLKPLFEEGVKLFITWAFDQECCREEGGVRCPCLKCGCRRIISDPKEVETHLKRKGFKENYWVWTSNGEEMPINMPETSNFQHGSCSRSHMEYEEQFNLHDDMIGDALGTKMCLKKCLFIGNQMSLRKNLKKQSNVEHQKGEPPIRAGSISIADHAERMAVAKRRAPLMQELHERTYRGRDGEYCDDRARDTQAEYQRLKKEFLAKHPELGGPHGRYPLDPAIDQYLWLQASKGKKRNGKIYATGPLASNYKKGIGILYLGELQTGKDLHVLRH